MTYRRRSRESPLLYVKPYTSSTLAMVQSEVINGFFIRLVKSFYIKPRTAARMHRYGAHDASTPFSLPIDDYSFFSSPRPSARASSTVFHLSPSRQNKTHNGKSFSPVMIFFSFFLYLSFVGWAFLRRGGNEFWSRRLYIFSERRVRFYRSFCVIRRILLGTEYSRNEKIYIGIIL